LQIIKIVDTFLPQSAIVIIDLYADTRYKSGGLEAEPRMSSEILQSFAEITGEVIGRPDRVSPDAKPWPWFCKNIFRKRDLQWAGYLGPFSKQADVLAFGLNIEFIPAWRRAFPKIKENIRDFSLALSKLENMEWHWWGRPGRLAKNPEIRFLAKTTWASEVDVTSWANELEDILNGQTIWSENIPMRPQIQIVRLVGISTQISDADLIRQNVRQVVADLESIAAFFR
jgi:hypothetical protein